MTRLEYLMKHYVCDIAAIEKNLKASPRDQSREKQLKQLEEKLKLAREAKEAGWETWPPRKVSELRMKLKAKRDAVYHSTKNGS